MIGVSSQGRQRRTSQEKRKSFGMHWPSATAWSKTEPCVAMAKGPEGVNSQCAVIEGIVSSQTGQLPSPTPTAPPQESMVWMCVTTHTTARRIAT
jgi:hypothetical protein